MNRVNFENYLAAARHLQNAAHMSTPVEVSKLCIRYHLGHDGITKDFLRGLDLNRPSEDVARDLIQAGVDYRARKASQAKTAPELFPRRITEAVKANPTPTADPSRKLYDYIFSKAEEIAADILVEKIRQARAANRQIKLSDMLAASRDEAANVLAAKIVIK